jgi:hypothetical protein
MTTVIWATEFVVSKCESKVSDLHCLRLTGHISRSYPDLIFSCFVFWGKYRGGLYYGVFEAKEHIARRMALSEF